MDPYSAPLDASASYTMRYKRAFTLLEMMIAVTLSAVIVYTAFSAFRVVGQTVANSQRMSLENGMMRTGFFAALDELDFWDLYDDRNASNPASNPLRAVGNPFCPVTWDPTKKPSDPKSWWRGFGFSTTVPNTNRWGNYSVLSRAGHSDPVRGWYPNQIKTINERMGGYGMISYLPGDAIFCWYESGGTPFTIKGEPRDVWERTAQTPVLVLKYAPDPPLLPNSVSTYPPAPPYPPASYNAGMYNELVQASKRPSNWPMLRAEARRYIVWSSFIDLCQVEVTSPITGQMTRLSFWGVGTTLRGARQQRGLDTVLVQ